MNSVLQLFQRKTHRVLKSPGLLNEVLATPRGHLHWWPGPTSRSSDQSKSYHALQHATIIAPPILLEVPFKESSIGVSLHYTADMYEV